jgi:phosphatidylserine/phosphatidylglycerophosphate/cardiolipin synthase-like enzyme
MRGVGDEQTGAIRPDFDRSISIDFQGAKITSDTGFLLSEGDRIAVRVEATTLLPSTQRSLTFAYPLFRGPNLETNAGHDNVGLFTLGNHRPDPRDPKKLIISETYIHSKNMAVIGDEWAIMTGGSANIAFTSTWFHSEMNIAFNDITRIKNWVAQLWKEHLGITIEDAIALIDNPDEALNTFKKQAEWNTATLTNGEKPVGRVYGKEGTVFPERDLKGIDLRTVVEPVVDK